jgi:hypothetical protein
MPNEYMGCPAGSKLIFQTKPSSSGNVAGWSGFNVFYFSGVFVLSNGTTISNGIATDTDGRIWDTGSGATIKAAPVTIPTVITQTGTPTVTTQTDTSTVTTQTDTSTVITQTGTPTVTTQTNASTVTTQAETSTVSTQTSAPVVTAELLSAEALITAIGVIDTYAKSASAVAMSIEELLSAGVLEIVVDNISAYRAAVAAAGNDGADSLEKIQLLIDGVNTTVMAAAAKVVADSKSDGELKAKQESNARAIGELKAKQDAVVKATAAKVASTKTSITCVKGKLTKKATALKPKCPTGYKLKK